MTKPKENPLSGVDFDEALKAMLGTAPPAKKSAKKAAPKKKAK